MILNSGFWSSKNVEFKILFFRILAVQNLEFKVFVVQNLEFRILTVQIQDFGRR